MKTPLSASFLAILCTALVGCFSSTLSPTTVAPREVERLRALGTKHLPLSFNVAPPRDAAVGFQYILLALPVARVYAPSLSQDVVDGLTSSAAAAGYSLETLTPGHAASPRLEVTASDITVSGYDLVFVRRPSASLTLSARLVAPGRILRSCEAEGSVTKTARFAFAPELEEVLRESIETATQKLMACLFPEAVSVSESSEHAEASE